LGISAIVRKAAGTNLDDLWGANMIILYLLDHLIVTWMLAIFLPFAAKGNSSDDFSLLAAPKSGYVAVSRYPWAKAFTNLTNSNVAIRKVLDTM
jgi:hypothetical protein